MSAPTVAIFLKKPQRCLPVCTRPCTTLHSFSFPSFIPISPAVSRYPLLIAFRWQITFFPGLHQPNLTTFSFQHLFICNCNHIIKLHTPWSVIEADLWPDTKKLEITPSTITHTHFWLVLLKHTTLFFMSYWRELWFCVQGRSKWNIFLVVPLLHPDYNLAL